ncbi:MAG TPA: GHKL domain-containing protein, partial [Candidatus Marinimicrobia bacterium]|nr:GHKL domain-containing protein [Candidatus Neomarinimicrobiota bacterium]
EEINNLHSLAKEFSEFARLPQANVEKIDLNFHLKEILVPYIDSHNITLALTEKNPDIMADKNQFKQVIVNIIQNAIHASKSEDEIEIVTEFDDPETIAIRIRDHGLGISKENLNHIFEPYFTNKEKGTGLGLAIVKRIVEQHDGKIEVESHIDQGTTFSLYFKEVSS